MLNRISHTGVWVTDQDEALAFYSDVLGFEVRMDVTMPEFGNMRWLSVGVPGQDVVLQLHAFDGPPLDDSTREQVSQLSRSASAVLVREEAPPTADSCTRDFWSFLIRLAPDRCRSDCRAMRWLLVLLALAAFSGCSTPAGGEGRRDVDPTPERIDGSESQEFEQDDIDRANSASQAVRDYCAGAVSEAQRVGCESHIDESDIP